VVVTCFLLTGSASGVRAAGDDRTVRRARVPSPRTRIACRRPRRSLSPPRHPTSTWRDGWR